NRYRVTRPPPLQPRRTTEPDMISFPHAQFTVTATLSADLDRDERVVGGWVFEIVADGEYVSLDDAADMLGVDVADLRAALVRRAEEIAAAEGREAQAREERRIARTAEGSL